MHKRHYHHGSAAAADVYGVKLAEPDDDADDHTLRNVGMAGAALAPWAGRIGEKPLIHEHAGPVKSWKDFRSLAQPGDVVIQGYENPHAFQFASGVSSGRPMAHHAEVVGPNGTIFGANEAGMASQPINALDPRTSRMHLLRPKLNDTERQQFLANIQQGADTSSTYSRELEKHLANAGHSPEMQKKLLRVSGNATYNTYDGFKSLLHNLFVPKLHSADAAEAQKAKTIAARAAFNANEGGVATQTAAKGMDRLKAFEPLKKVPYAPELFQAQVTPACVGSVCTTYPAQALPHGKNVVPGKLPSHILGADYLRSDLFEPIARYGDVKRSPFHEKLLRHGPTAARLGAGALLAGGVYGGSKLLEHFRRPKPAETPQYPSDPSGP